MLSTIDLVSLAITISSSVGITYTLTLLWEGHGTSTMIQSGLVPEDHNDFIFTVACEEFGFLGGVFLLALLLAVMLLSLYAAFKAVDMMGRFMCIGFFAMIATQTIFNIGMCSERSAFV